MAVVAMDATSAVLDSIELAMASAAERKEQLRKTFLELLSLRGGVSTLNIDWSDLEEHFSEQEGNVRRKFEELVAKERILEDRSRGFMDEINKREEIVTQKEEAVLARVQNEKDAALVEKRKWKDERKRLDLEHNGDVFENDDDVMEDAKKEPASSARTASDQPMDTDPQAVVLTTSKTIRKDPGGALAKAEVRVRPYLKCLCENMDGEGLRKYIVDHRKDMGALRNEMPSALQYAIDPARLVLNAIQGYYLPDHVNDKKEIGTSANRRACILLLEALASFLAHSILGVDHPVVTHDMELLARDLAEQWRSKMDIQDAPDGNSLDAQAFLQLLATFGLTSEYDEEELCKLVLAVARRKQTPALCRALNLSHKIPEIVEHLTNDSKQIEALAFAHAFDMMDGVEPVPLLKAYLKDARKNVHKGGNNNQAQNDSVTKELAALKNVLKCIEDYHLEHDYPLSPLHRRVAHLEKTKSERKRTGGSVKGQAKRPRNAGYERSYYRPSEKAQVFNGVTLTSYNLAPQTSYDRRSSYSSYGSGTATTAGGSYIYSVDGSLYGSNLYGSQSASYSNYQLGTGLPPPPPAYQASFMH